ncbi:MAG: CsbD family protein [Gammaproteobacteria bacterium]
MNWEQVRGHWKLLKGTVKQKWGNLTKEEINIVEGKREELIGRLEAKYGYTKEKAEAEVDAWARNL